MLHGCRIVIGVMLMFYMLFILTYLIVFFIKIESSLLCLLKKTKIVFFYVEYGLRSVTCYQLATVVPQKYDSVAPGDWVSCISGPVNVETW